MHILPDDMAFGMIHLPFLCSSYLHVRLREYAESIAFSRGEKEEQIRAQSSLDKLLYAQRKVINKELPLEGKQIFLLLKLCTMERKE
jgi:hypothetical protein